jgi:hypothetical protein
VGARGASWGIRVIQKNKKYFPEQFDIIGITNHQEMAGIPYKNNNCYAEINGQRKYIRLFIKVK